MVQLDVARRKRWCKLDVARRKKLDVDRRNRWCRFVCGTCNDTFGMDDMVVRRRSVDAQLMKQLCRKKRYDHVNF